MQGRNNVVNTETAERLKTDKALADQSVVTAQLEGSYVVLKDNQHNPTSTARRVVLCDGGFGCNPCSIGRARFCTELSTGQTNWYGHDEFKRFATDEEVEEAKMFLKTFGFDAVTKREEVREQLLLQARVRAKKEGGVGEARLVIHKGIKRYRLRVYGKDDEGKWQVLSTYTAYDVPDKLLRKLHKGTL